MSDLEAATVSNLVDELQKRFPNGLLVVGLRDANGEGDTEEFFSEEEFYICALSKPTVSIGMASRALSHLQRSARRQAEDVRDEQ